MRLITAIAALALVAGSLDVDAQTRGDASKKPGGEEGKPQIGPLVHIAGGLFGELYPDERGELIDEAKGGDEEAQEALIADDIVALEEVIEGLKDEETKKWIRLGMALATSVFSHPTEDGTARTDGTEGGQSWIQTEDTDTLLDNLQEELELAVDRLDNTGRWF